MKVYQLLAQEAARVNRLDWERGAALRESIEAFVTARFPSGSGFDCGTRLDLARSTGERLVFDTSFHHMDDMGGYCGWSFHAVIVTPSLQWGYSVRVTGFELKRGGDIKAYIAEAFSSVLDRDETSPALACE